MKQTFFMMVLCLGVFLTAVDSLAQVNHLSTRGSSSGYKSSSGKSSRGP